MGANYRYSANWYLDKWLDIDRDSIQVLGFSKESESDFVKKREQHETGVKEASKELSEVRQFMRPNNLTEMELERVVSSQWFVDAFSIISSAMTR